MSSSLKVVMLSETLYAVKQHPHPSQKYHLHIRGLVFQITKGHFHGEFE